jgi:hypothetical protein
MLENRKWCRHASAPSTYSRASSLVSHEFTCGREQKAWPREQKRRSHEQKARCQEKRRAGGGGGVWRWCVGTDLEERHLHAQRRMRRQVAKGLGGGSSRAKDTVTTEQGLVAAPASRAEEHTSEEHAQSGGMRTRGTSNQTGSGSGGTSRQVKSSQQRRCASQLDLRVERRLLHQVSARQVKRWR